MLNSCRDLEKLSKGPCLSFSAFIVLDMLVGKSEDGPYTYDYGNTLRPVMETPSLETPVSLWGLQPLPQFKSEGIQLTINKCPQTCTTPSKKLQDPATEISPFGTMNVQLLTLLLALQTVSLGAVTCPSQSGHILVLHAS